MDTTYGFTKKYLTKDGMPWFPVMGEIHFSRYRADLWEESLRKMKAGGLSIASAYVIWIHHEDFLYFFALVRGYMERQETEDSRTGCKKNRMILI